MLNGDRCDASNHSTGRAMAKPSMTRPVESCTTRGLAAVLAPVSL